MKATIEIDGTDVEIEIESVWDEEIGLITSVNLRGDRRYDGHVHGRSNVGTETELAWCFPRVVDSVALFNDGQCDLRPDGLGASIMACWYVRPNN